MANKRIYDLTENTAPASGEFLAQDKSGFAEAKKVDMAKLAILAGQAGGQTLYGGTAANEDITIHGTSNSTRTTSYVLLQPTAGNVGIGTTAPETLLHVGSTAKISGFAAHILAESNASSTASGIIVQADAQTDGAYMTLVTRGAVGGTGGGAAIAMYDGATTFNSGSLAYAGGNASGSRYLGLLAGKDRDGNYIPIRLYTTDAAGNLQGAMYIQGGQTAATSGNVGIGTSAPSAKWHVVYADAAANIAVLENSTTGQVRMSFQRSGDTGTGTSKGMVFFVTATQAGWADYEQRQLGFFTNNGTATAERVRITYTGGFVVGNTYIAANRNPGAGNAIIEGTLGIGTYTADSILHASLTDTGTNTAAQVVTISHNGGTAAAGFGSRILWELESSTTDDQTAAALDVAWSDATDATRTSRILLQLVSDAATARWLHNHADATADGFNIFMGWGAGNLTLSPAGGAAGLASNNIGIGAYTLDALTTGYKNTATGGAALSGVTTGYGNSAFGYGAGYDLTEGYLNVMFGNGAGENITTGDGNVALGPSSLTTCTTGDNNVAIGNSAGYYETGSNKLFIDNRTRSDEADGRAKALVYGVFAATTAAQTLALNAVVTVSDGVRVTAGSVQVGGTAARGTTAGTNRIDLFDGTAPAGTLTNGVSIYSKAGEFYALDAAGNETLNSPHDPETGEWIFWSRNTVTGRTYRVDMERMVAAIEALTGQSFTTETFESLPN